ncbi:hypothetical protein [Lacrimispora brassicae]
MKNNKDSEYKKFKKVMIVIGIAAALAVLHGIIFWLFPLIKEIHGF